MKIQYVNQPGPNSTGKYGNIKGDGVVYQVPVEDLGRYQVGMTIVNPTVEKQSWGGKIVEVISSAWHPSTAGVVAGNTVVQPQPQQWQRPAPNPIQAQPYMPPPPPITYAIPNSGLDQAGQIFVTGVVGRAMGSGKFSATEIEVLVDAAIRAWNMVPR